MATDDPLSYEEKDLSFQKIREKENYNWLLFSCFPFFSQRHKIGSTLSLIVYIVVTCVPKDTNKKKDTWYMVSVYLDKQSIQNILLTAER